MVCAGAANAFEVLNGSGPTSVDDKGNVKKKRNRRKKHGGGGQEHEEEPQQQQPAKPRAQPPSPPQAEGWKTVGKNTSSDNSGNCWGRVQLLKRMDVVRVIA